MRRKLTHIEGTVILTEWHRNQESYLKYSGNTCHHGDALNRLCRDPTPSQRTADQHPSEMQEEYAGSNKAHQGMVKCQTWKQRPNINKEIEQLDCKFLLCLRRTSQWETREKGKKKET